MIYNRAFFHRRVKLYHAREVALAHLWYEVLQPLSVVDLGCGIGSYMTGFAECGIWTLGYEYGHEYAQEFYDQSVAELIWQCDLTERIDHPYRMDMSMSIEVAEHLPESAADTFCDNLYRSSTRLILLSAAAPGQRGRGHLNCQPAEYWIEKMAALGATYDAARTAELKLRMSMVDDLDLSDRMMVYRI